MELFEKNQTKFVNQVTFEKEEPESDRFSDLHKKAEAAFSVETLTEKTGNKKFAEAFNAVLRLPENCKVKDEQEAVKQLKKQSGNPYSGRMKKYPHLLLGHALISLYEEGGNGSWMINYLEQAVLEHRLKHYVDLFFALPAVVKKIECAANRGDENHIALLAILIIQEYGLAFDKEKLLLLADKLETALKDIRKYRMGIEPERLRDIANGLYNGVLDSIRSFRSLAHSAEKNGNSEEAAGYYFEAAKLADFASICDYLRLTTDLNRDIAFTDYKSKDERFFEKCRKAAMKKKTVSEKISALQPAMDILYPAAFTVASSFYEKAGDEEKAREMNEKAILLGDANAIRKNFQIKDAELFARDTDYYMRHAFLLLTKVARREGKLADDFEIIIGGSYDIDFFNMLAQLCKEPDFYEDDATPVPQLDDRQKQIVFAWAFRGKFDPRIRDHYSNLLPILFDIGFGTPVNKEVAIKNWTKSIVKNSDGTYGFYSGESAYHLGRAYLLGDGVAADKEKAVEYLKIAEQNSRDRSPAKKLLELSEKSTAELISEGVAYHNNGDYEKALGYFETAAQLGSGTGCYNAGVCYFKGQGTEKDERKAYAYFRKGADKNVHCAYHTGLDCVNSKDYPSARIYFEKAASMEDYDNSSANGNAALELANLYYDGKLTEKKDTMHYVFWAKKAIDTGNVASKNDKKRFADTTVSSYELLMEFNSVRQKQLSDEYAVFVLEKAVEAKIIGAQEELGIRYYTGLGVAANKNKAFTLLTRAQKETHTERCDYYLACWYADKAVECYFGHDLQGLFDSIKKASKLIIETPRELDSENKRDLVHLLYEYVAFEIAATNDEEQDENEIEERFLNIETLFDAVKARFPDIATAVAYDINIGSVEYCSYLDEDEKESRFKAAHRYLCRGIKAGNEWCKEKYAEMTNDVILAIAGSFLSDEPEIALFYLGTINETDSEAMILSGGLHKLVYHDNKKALYYFDKALRAGSDDYRAFIEIGLPEYDSDGYYLGNSYGLTLSQQKEYLKMSAANGCEEARRALDALRRDNLL